MFCLYGNANAREIASPAQQRSAAAILMNMLLEGDVAAAAMAMPTVLRQMTRRPQVGQPDSLSLPTC